MQLLHYTVAHHLLDLVYFNHARCKMSHLSMWLVPSRAQIFTRPWPLLCPQTWPWCPIFSRYSLVCSVLRLPSAVALKWVPSKFVIPAWFPRLPGQVTYIIMLFWAAEIMGRCQWHWHYIMNNSVKCFHLFFNKSRLVSWSQFQLIL